MTNDLVDECNAASTELYPSSEDWRNSLLKQDTLDLVARLSSRVFLGQPLCRNKSWLEISKSYTVNVFKGAARLRATPALFRRLVAWYGTECVALRQEVKDARRIIRHEVKARQIRAQEVLASSQKPPKTSDAIGWMVELAQKKGISPDYSLMQINLSIAAIHTTTEALTHALLDTCQQPGVIDELGESCDEAGVVGVPGSG